MSAGEGAVRVLWIWTVFAAGGLTGDRLQERRSRVTECELRFEIAETPTDSLTVIREHPYCWDAP